MSAFSPRIAVFLLLAVFLVGCGGSSTPPCQGATCPCTGSNCPAPTSDFLFQPNSNQVSGFQVDAVSGTVLATLPNVAGPASGGGVTLTSTNFLYVSDFQNNVVYGYSVDATSGALTPISSSPFSIAGLTTSQGTTGMASDPAGKFLYVVNGNNNAVAAFTINSTGQLATVTGSPFATSTSPQAAVVDHSGKFLYVSNNEDALGGISAYSIDAAGALTPVPGSPFSTLVNGGPAGLAASPTGNFLYVAMAGTTTAGNQIVAETINPSTGALSPVVGSPFGTGNAPLTVTIDPSGKFLYSTNSADSTVSGFSLDPTSGALTSVGSATATGPQPFAAVINSTTGLLFVACVQSTSISAYTVNSSGALTSIAPVNGSGGGSGLAIVARP
jgi:6-phosphogluconolactonase